jgi:hypothetical protein
VAGRSPTSVNRTLPWLRPARPPPRVKCCVAELRVVRSAERFDRRDLIVFHLPVPIEGHRRSRCLGSRTPPSVGWTAVGRMSNAILIALSDQDDRLGVARASLRRAGSAVRRLRARCRVDRRSNRLDHLRADGERSRTPREVGAASRRAPHCDDRSRTGGRPEQSATQMGRTPSTGSARDLLVR